MVKKKIAKKKVAKRKVVKKKVTKKKVSKARTIKVMSQTGTSNKNYDARKKAKLPGKRISKTGRKYTERRKNRSDKKGSDL